jgi:hypothetical protein
MTAPRRDKAVVMKRYGDWFDHIDTKAREIVALGSEWMSRKFARNQRLLSNISTFTKWIRR